VAERRCLGRFVSEHPPYSLLARGIERDVLPVCQRHGLAVLPWSPIAGGFLSGRYRRGGETPRSQRVDRVGARFDLTLPQNQAKLEAVYAFGDLAEEAGLPLIELALAFVLQHPAVTSALIGPRTMEHLKSQLPGAERKLDAALLDRIDEIVPPGTYTSTADIGWTPPALENRAQRRR
jgi:aryl-alcohol dehydrogenase-like predicted oxidoreductase